MSQQLLDWMKANGIRGSELARRLGMDPSTVSKVVGGSRRPGGAFRWQFAQRFGMAEATAVFGVGQNSPEPSAVEEQPA